MDAGTALGLSMPIGVGLAAIGSGLGLGAAVSGATTAMGRQPQAAGKIQTAMIIGAAMIEALTIYALVVVFILMNRIPEVPKAADEAEQEANAGIVLEEQTGKVDQLAEAGIVIDETF